MIAWIMSTLNIAAVETPHETYIYVEISTFATKELNLTYQSLPTELGFHQSLDGVRTNLGTVSDDKIFTTPDLHKIFKLLGDGIIYDSSINMYCESDPTKTTAAAERLVKEFGCKPGNLHGKSSGLVEVFAILVTVLCLSYIGIDMSYQSYLADFAAANSPAASIHGWDGADE